MALDPRLMPSVASLRSSASTPSLRSRDGSIMGRMDAPGGNVRVVVRVRGFLPRGTLFCIVRYLESGLIVMQRPREGQNV